MSDMIDAAMQMLKTEKYAAASCKIAIDDSGRSSYYSRDSDYIHMPLSEVIKGAISPPPFTCYRSYKKYFGIVPSDTAKKK